MLLAFEEGKPPETVSYPRRDALPDDPNKPSEDILIDVPWRLTKEQIDDERRTRSDAVARWGKVCPDATEHELGDPEKFADRLGRESGEFLIRQYIEHHERCGRMYRGEEPLDPRLVVWAINSQDLVKVDCVCEYYREKSDDHATATEKARAFFCSEHYVQIPSVRIGSLLIAAVLRKKASGRQPREGDIGDINMIRHFAPYCDAMLVDKFFHDLVTESAIKIDERYGLRFFSARSRDEFFCWLEDHERVFIKTLKPRESKGEIPDQRIGARLLRKQQGDRQV